MLVLGISTSTAQIGVALGDATGVRATWSAVRGREHAELITPAIASVCDAAGVAVADVALVAVDQGPGLFTGLRVGVATAKACAFALSVPMIAVSSLDLLAFGVRYSNRKVTAVLDARRGELFVADYVAVPGGMQRLSEPRTISPDDLVAELAADPDPHVLIGTGAIRYQELFAGCDRAEVADVGVMYPSVEALVHLAHAQAMREEWVQPSEVRCVYLRQPDAEINWETRHGQVRA